jgi:hypothetical protein
MGTAMGQRMENAILTVPQGAMLTARLLQV